MTPAAAAARKAVQTRNATEEAILDAARAALAEKGFDALTMDSIARKAFVSRTAVYFYFPNKRAVVDRLIQQCFSEMYLAASPYLDGDGDPRRELRASLARVVARGQRQRRAAAAGRPALRRARRAPAGGVGALHHALRRARRGAHRARPGARHRARRHRAAALGPGPAGHGREPHHARAGAQARRRERVDPHARRAVVARGVLAAWAPRRRPELVRGRRPPRVRRRAAQTASPRGSGSDARPGRAAASRPICPNQSGLGLGFRAKLGLVRDAQAEDRPRRRATLPRCAVRREATRRRRTTQRRRTTPPSAPPPSHARRRRRAGSRP